MNLLDYRSFALGNDWTEAFRTAIDALSRIDGGTLRVPAGLYWTRSIELISDMTLQVDSGATLRFLPGPDGYDAIPMEFEGIHGTAYRPLVFADGKKNVRIVGPGTIDGCGVSWWGALRAGELQHARPYLVCFRNCTHVSIEDVTLLNSPVWTVHPLRCEDVAVRGVTIRNPADSPNTDGINPDCCRNVRISDCLIDVGDDCIAIKSGTEDTETPFPSENILITGCQMLNGHGGVVIGSEMSGGVRNVQVNACIFEGTDRGIRVKTRRKRGGHVENLAFSNILMRRVDCPFVFNMYYFCGKEGKAPYVSDKAPHPVDAGTPAISDVRITDVTVREARVSAGFVYGLPEMPVERLTLRDVTVTMQKGRPGQAAMLADFPDQEAAGFFIRNAKDVVMQNVRIVGQEGPIVDSDETVTWGEA